MSTTTDRKLMTADELLKLGDIGRCELIYGELVMMSPAGAEHGMVAIQIGAELRNFVRSNDLGFVFAAETGFKVESDPDLVRAPDVSFVRKSRLPHGPPKSFIDGVPDLAVEVVSPGESRREIAEKVNMWLAHGCESVWVAYPSTQTVVVHHPDGGRRELTRSDTLEDDVLRGFAVDVESIFNFA